MLLQRCLWTLHLGSWRQYFLILTAWWSWIRTGFLVLPLRPNITWCERNPVTLTLRLLTRVLHVKLTFHFHSLSLICKVTDCLELCTQLGIAYLSESLSTLISDYFALVIFVAVLRDIFLRRRLRICHCFFEIVWRLNWNPGYSLSMGVVHWLILSLIQPCRDV